MRRAELLSICTLAVATLSAIYAPQPILPMLAETFGEGQAAASLVITLTLLPLGVAPLVYGIVLQRISPRTLLLFSTLLLAASELVAFWAPTLPAMLAVRLAQGVLIAAMLTGMMTHLGQRNHGHDLQHALALYVGATIFGGFFGRFTAGMLSSWFGWRSPFLALAVALAACTWPISRLERTAPAATARPSPHALAAALRRPGFLRCYAMIFCCFFVFASLLNVLPFRLEELSPNISALRIAMTYAGYLMGILISLNTVRLIRAVRGERRMVTAGLAVYLAALALFLAPSAAVVAGAMFVLCTGMFAVHNVVPGYLNRHAADQKGVVNGLYISFYYTGGTLGSVLPGIIYQHGSWSGYLACLAALVGVAAWASAGLRAVQCNNPHNH